MISISSALSEIINSNSFLQTGLSEGLFNLSRLAEMIRPQVEARTKKQVSSAAILMGLSRLKRAKSKAAQTQKFRIDDIFVTGNLCALTYPNTSQIQRGVNIVHNKIQRSSSLMTISQGIREICVILPRGDVPLLRDAIQEKPISSHSALGAVSISFKSDYQKMPGFFYSVFQKLYFQSINIIEISSTAHELVIFLHEEEAKLAFDTLFQSFLIRERQAK